MKGLKESTNLGFSWIVLLVHKVFGTVIIIIFKQSNNLRENNGV